MWIHNDLIKHQTDATISNIIFYYVSIFKPLSQLISGFGDPDTLQVSLIVCPIFDVQSDNSNSNTGGPVHTNTQIYIKHTAVLHPSVYL